MKVVLVSATYPWPESCGKAKVLSGICRGLQENDSVETVKYVHLSRLSVKPVAKGKVEYHHIKGPSFSAVVWRAFVSTIKLRFDAIQEIFTYSERSKCELHQYLAEIKPDLVIIDTVRMAQYFYNIDTPSYKMYVYLDDLFSLRYRRILDILDLYPTRDIDPLGNFSAFIPKPLRFFTSHRFLLRFLLRYEEAAVRRSELRIVKHFERSFLINPDEVKAINKTAGISKVHTLKLRLADSAQVDVVKGDGRYFVFLGDLQLAHNRLSIKQFVAAAGPLMAKLLPGWSVYIVGKGADTELLESCRTSTCFKYCGYVDDLNKLLSGARGMLAPLLFGSGVKIKVLDALRIGLPIIGSHYGVEGLGLKSGVDYLHAEGVAATVDAMAALVDEPRFKQLSASSYEWYQKNYSAAVVSVEHRKLLLE